MEQSWRVKVKVPGSPAINHAGLMFVMAIGSSSGMLLKYALVLRRVQASSTTPLFEAAWAAGTEE